MPLQVERAFGTSEWDASCELRKCIGHGHALPETCLQAIEEVSIKLEACTGLSFDDVSAFARVLLQPGDAELVVSVRELSLDTLPDLLPG